MSLPNDIYPNGDGATPATNQTVIDAELADWVYHRAANDQGLSLQDIENGATIYVTNDTLKGLLFHQGFSIGKDGFIYNQSTGFCCAIVDEGNNNFAIVVRGSDVGNSDALPAALVDASNGTPSTVPGGVDELDVYQDAQQGAGSLAPTQADDLLNVIQALKSSVTGANIRLVGQSLGGGDAGVAATIDGLQADVFDPAPFANQIIAENVRTAARSVGVVLPQYGLTSLSPNVSSGTLEGVGGDTPGIYSAGDYVASLVSPLEYNAFLATYNQEIAAQAGAKINAYSIQGEFLTATWTGALFATFSGQIPSASLTTYSVGPFPSILDNTTAFALHSPTLLALVLATNDFGTFNGKIPRKVLRAFLQATQFFMTRFLASLERTILATRARRQVTDRTTQMPQGPVASRRVVPTQASSNGPF